MIDIKNYFLNIPFELTNAEKYCSPLPGISASIVPESLQKYKSPFNEPPIIILSLKIKISSLVREIHLGKDVHYYKQ